MGTGFVLVDTIDVLVELAVRTFDEIPFGLTGADAEHWGSFVFGLY